MIDFNVNDYYTDETDPMDYLVEPGKHAAKIVLSEMKPTKNAREDESGEDKSENLYLEYEIINNEKYSGKIIREWLCIKNKNDFAQDIARKKLSKLAITLGIDQLKNADQLLDKSLYIEVGIEDPQKKDPNSKFGPNNRINKYIRQEKKEIQLESDRTAEPFNDSIPF